MMTEKGMAKEQPDKDEYWQSELRSLGVEPKRKNDLNDREELEALAVTSSRYIIRITRLHIRVMMTRLDSLSGDAVQASRCRFNGCACATSRGQVSAYAFAKGLALYSHRQIMDAPRRSFIRASCWFFN